MLQPVLLENLPSDVLGTLCSRLPQRDLLTVAAASSTLYALAHQHLYHTIVVDLARRVFDAAASTASHDAYVHAPLAGEPVVVRSLYALTRLLKNLVAHPGYARKVRLLVVAEEFPDMPALELRRYLRQIFPSLAALRVLNWYAATTPLPASLVCLLPNPHLLHSLGGNLLHSVTGDGLPGLDFAYLRHLDLSNVGAAQALLKLDLDAFPNVRSLTLAKRASSNRLPFSSRPESCCSGAPTTEAPPFADLFSYIQSLFSNPLRSKLALSLLSIKDIAVSADDAELLLANIDVAALSHLSIDNCTEFLFADAAASTLAYNVTRRTPPSRLFLEVLATELTGLELLSINLSNELCFNTSTFNFISRLQGLEKLAVHIKLYHTNEPADLAPLVDALQPHAGTLSYLNLCCNVVEPLSVALCPMKKNQYSLESIQGLSKLTELRVLRLPIASTDLSEVPQLVSSLHNLRVIQLGITDLAAATSPGACNSCDNTLIYALYNTNCLISQDYFNCPSSFTSGIEENKNQHYLNVAGDFKALFPKLHYLRYDLKNQSLLYDCTRADSIVAKDSILIDRFDSLMAEHI